MGDDHGRSILLAVGAVLAGMEFYPAIPSAITEDDVLGPRSSTLPRETRRRCDSMLHAFERRAELGEVLPVLLHAVRGLRRSPTGSSMWKRPAPAGPARRAPPAAVPVPAQQVVLRRALRLIFVRPAMWIGRFLWKRGDGGTIDGIINGLAMGSCPYR